MTNDEINKAVAVRIMGWKYMGASFGSYDYYNRETEKYIMRNIDFCNSWADMGELVEKMKPDSLHISQSFRKDKPIWTAAIYMGGDMNTTFRVRNDSITKAVALAALKAKGVDIGS